MSELLDKQVKQSLKKNFGGSCTLLQATKVCNENESRIRKNHVPCKKDFDGRKEFIRRTRNGHQLDTMKVLFV